jgi:hypothetical protein
MAGGTEVSAVDGVVFDFMQLIRDLRSNLTAREIGKGLLFLPRRYSVIFDVPSKEVHGEHAHRKRHQLLVSLFGPVPCMVTGLAGQVSLTFMDIV